MRVSEDPDLNIQGVGPTLGAAFAEAALAMTAAVTDPAAIRHEETTEIECAAPSAELLLVNWLNAVASEMAARGMVFGAFNIDTDGFQLRATAIGERVSKEWHALNVKIKEATLRGLAVTEDRPGEWRVQCTVEFARL